MLDDRWMCHAGVRSAQFLRDFRVAHRHALDVGLVDDRLRVIMAGAMVAFPVEEGVDHDGMHRSVGGVTTLESERIIGLIGQEVE